MSGKSNPNQTNKKKESSAIENEAASGKRWKLMQSQEQLDQLATELEYARSVVVNENREKDFL